MTASRYQIRRESQKTQPSHMPTIRRGGRGFGIGSLRPNGRFGSSRGHRGRRRWSAPDTEAAAHQGTGRFEPAAIREVPNASLDRDLLSLRAWPLDLLKAGLNQPDIDSSLYTVATHRPIWCLVRYSLTAMMKALDSSINSATCSRVGSTYSR